MKQPRTSFHLRPFNYIKTQFDSIDQIWELEDNSGLENVFNNTQDYPKILNTICEIIPKSVFNNVTINFKFRNNIQEQNYQFSQFSLYNGQDIDMNSVVSQVDIMLKTILCEDIEMPENKLLFSKHFPIQNHNFEVKSIEQQEDMYLNTLSPAYYFAGGYKIGTELWEIQPYLFFVERKYLNNPEINIVSTKNFVNQDRIKLDINIDYDKLSTLEDDILEGKLSITLPNGIAYHSVSGTKTSITSNFINIIFYRTN